MKYDGRDHWPICSCGWVGVPQLTEGMALLVSCEVEELLAVSQCRRRRLFPQAAE